MEVILLERIEKLGQMGDVVNVKAGFARNYLLPQNKALRKTKQNLTRFESQRAQLEAENLTKKTEAEKIADKLKGMKITILRAAGSDLGPGRLPSPQIVLPRGPGPPFGQDRPPRSCSRSTQGHFSTENAPRAAPRAPQDRPQRPQGWPRTVHAQRPQQPLKPTHRGPPTSHPTMN